MPTQAEYSSSLSHTHALLTLLQLHHYQELCYQLYLYTEALKEVERSLPPKTDTTQTSTYDSHGRLAKTTQPKGLELINSYNDYGYLESIKSPAPQIQGFDRAHFKGLLSDMKDQAANYEKLYEEAAKSYDTLFKRASYYQALADKYGASATRLHAIADELSSKASRMEAYMYRAKDAFFKELQRIQAYTTLANQFKKEWIGTGLATWLSDYHSSIRNYTHSWVSRILLLVLSPTPNHQDYESWAANQQFLADKNLDQAEAMLSQVVKSYQEMRYYESLSDAGQAFQEMVDDTAYTYHYKLLQTDSHGRVTSYISGNGLINSNTYDDSGAMVSSKTGYTTDTLLRDLEYEYDELYNQSKRVDKFLGVTATYQYDVLSRIEHAHFVMSKTGKTEDLYYEYDPYGNLMHKDGQGDYHYSPTHPNRLLSTDQRTFEYDANGNMLKNGTTILAYNAANKVTTITTNSGTTTFAYDMNQHRYQKTTDDTVTTYIDKVYEHIENTEYGFTEDKYLIYAGDKVVAVYSEYHGTRYEHTIAYLHHDALGSVDTITNAQGEVVQRSAYKPFGERITIEQSSTERAITNRGYTGHEEIEGTDLVHANARIYDPTLGRFMSADTLIQDPYDTQSYNRYSYVRNNPLKYSDPSGHSFMSFIKALIVAVVVIAVTVATLGASTVASLGYFGALKAASIGMLVKIGAIAGFAGSFTSAILSGASPGQALIAGATGALIGAVTAGLSNRIAGVLGHTGNYLRRAIAHGIVSGMMNMVRGGNFGSGFMSTFFSTIAGGIKVGAGWIQGAFQTLVGGTASVIGGGKFANGAVSAAMVWVFNDAMAADYAARKIAASRGILGDMAVKNSQNASSYIEIIEARKKIDALYSSGADVVIVMSGFGETVQIAKLTLTEAKTLMRLWGKGSFRNRAESIRFHASKHGGGDYVKYLRKAANFNFKGARSTGVRMDGSIKYIRPSGEFIIKRDNLIITYGKNKL